MAPAKRFIVLGAGGHGRVVADLVRVLGNDVVGYADADATKLGSAVDVAGATVMLEQDELIACARGEMPWRVPVDAIALGVGANAARSLLLGRIGAALLPALVHPRSSVSSSVRIGAGTVVFAGAVINTGAVLGDGVIINSGAIVEHDCLLDAAVHISPAATLCGTVTVGARAWVAAASVVIPGRRVGADSIVGAGAVVIHDVPDGITVVGNPARAIPRTASLSAADR